MSFAAVTKVAKITTGDDKSKSVLMWLAFHLNEETGLCCPSFSLLRKEMEVGSDNTVRAALTRLRERGLVSWTREIEDGVIKRTLYTLHLDASTVAPTSTTEPHSITDVPQPLNGGPSMAEQGSLNGCAGVPQPVNGNKEIEHGIEQGKEQGSIARDAKTPCLDTNPNPPSLSTENEPPLPFEDVPPIDDDPEGFFDHEADLPEADPDAPVIATEAPPGPESEEGTEAKEKPKGKRKASDRGCTIPFATLPDEWRKDADKLAPKLDPDLCWVEFYDYWRGVPGAKGRKAGVEGWRRTWCNHLRKMADWEPKRLLKKQTAQSVLAAKKKEYAGWLTGTS